MELELSLVQAGLVSSDDLFEALCRREDERPPLGQIAIEEGLLGVRQVLDVIRVQRASERGKRFGEVAVELRLLSEEQVAHLLALQEQRQRPVLQHLVELGKISYDEAANATRQRWRSTVEEPEPASV